MQAPSPSVIGLIALLALLSWRAYQRFKRMVGRQHLSKRRPWITLTVFPLLMLLLGYGARAEPQRLGWMIAGVAVGALLAVYFMAYAIGLVGWRSRVMAVKRRREAQRA